LASSTVDETLAARRALTGCKALYIEYIKYLSVVERLIRSLGNTRFCWITPGLTAGQGVENHCLHCSVVLLLSFAGSNRLAL
jgi:hypothetical protein